jgi:RNA polymerase sigma-70 factor, ECF subfamily
MNEHNWLAEQFEENRSHLQAVAYWMLGSVSDGFAYISSSGRRSIRGDRCCRKNPGGGQSENEGFSSHVVNDSYR